MSNQLNIWRKKRNKYTGTLKYRQVTRGCKTLLIYLNDIDMRECCRAECCVVKSRPLYVIGLFIYIKYRYVYAQYMLMIVFTRAKIFSHMIWKNHILSFHKHTSTHKKKRIEFLLSFSRAHIFLCRFRSERVDYHLFFLHKICMGNECCYYSVYSPFQDSSKDVLLMSHGQ